MKLFTSILLFFVSATFIIATPAESAQLPSSQKEAHAILISEQSYSPRRADYKKLSTLGNVYYEIHSPNYLIFVGDFTNIFEANKILTQVKEMGFYQAKLNTKENAKKHYTLWPKASSTEYYSGPVGEGEVRSYSSYGTELTPKSPTAATEYNYTNRGTSSARPNSYSTRGNTATAPEFYSSNDYMPRRVGSPDLTPSSELVTEIISFSRVSPESENRFSFKTPRKAAFNAKKVNRAITLGNSGIQSIRFYITDFFNNSQFKAPDLMFLLSIGQGNYNVERKQSADYFEFTFDASKLNRLPEAMSYMLWSNSANVKLDVSIPINWVEGGEGLSAYGEIPNGYENSSRNSSRFGQGEVLYDRGLRSSRDRSSSVIPDDFDSSIEGRRTELYYGDEELAPEFDVNEGYAIQVAAVSKTPNMDNYGALEDFGRLYYDYANKFYKIRVGLFPTKHEAEKALRSIKKTYRKAYILKEGNLEATLSEKGGEQPVEYDTPRVRKSSPSKKSSSSLTDKGIDNSIGEFVIQLVAYKNVDNFNSEGLSSYGSIWQQKKKNGTIIKYLTLNGRQTLTQAQSTLNRVQKAGFQNAFLMEKVGGKLLKVY